MVSFVDAQTWCFQEDPVLTRHLSAVPLVNTAVCFQLCSNPARISWKSSLVKLVDCCLDANLVGADLCGLHDAGSDEGLLGIRSGVAWPRTALL